MKYLNILIVVGIICLFNINITYAAIDNGTLDIHLDNNIPLLYNAEYIQITIVNVENNFENIVWKDEGSLPFDKSFSVYPGIYKVYIRKGNSTVIEFNNDSTGYTITSQSKIDIPNIRLLPFQSEYINTPVKDILSDIPWRINSGENIPITYIIKDANEWPAYFRTITVYNDGDPIGSEAGDTLLFTHPLWRTFAEDFWYDYDILSPSLFNQKNSYINIHIKFDIDWEFDVHNFYTTYVSPYNLPHLDNWSYGDTHYNSSYTDNVYEFGAPIRSTSVAGKAIGLEWATITDHSFDLDPNRWNNLVSDSNYFSTMDFRILPSEEISCTLPAVPGYSQKYNHYLAYGITGFIPGGEWEDGTGSHYSCAELVSIVKTQGGFGYPAHPADNADPFRDPWRNYSLNFSGLEIWNGVENVEKLEEGLNKWKELLLNGRKIFIEAGSDAHGDFNSLFGKVRTTVFTPYISNNEILSALRDGHSIMTDGPLVVFGLNNTIIGDTIMVPKGNRINLNIRWNSTPEFGTINNITVIKGIIGDKEIIEQEIYPFSYSGTSQIILTATQDEYIRLMAFTSDRHRTYTNPIWIKILSTRMSSGSVENLMNTTYGRTCINWTWQNPPDPDFSHVRLYLNGNFKTNIMAPQNYYNFTGLEPDILYELGTHTVDSFGNVNETWVNATARTAPSEFTPIQITNPSANPAIILNDNGRTRPPGTNITLLNVTVTGNVASVSIDLSSIGGSSSAPMIKISGTDIYSINTNATAGINLTNDLVVNVTDTGGNFNNSAGIPVTVLLRGDIVRDNKIDLKDLLYMRRYLAGLEPSINTFVADIQQAQGDSSVDLKDLLYLRRYLAGLEPLI